jgi:hypothetical protein
LPESAILGTVGYDGGVSRHLDGRFFRFQKGESMEKSSGHKQAWEPMTLKYVGDAGELLEGGTGKKSPVPTDPGEIFKEPGHG